MEQSTVVICGECGIVMDPDEDAVEFEEEQTSRVGIDIGPGVIKVPHYAHVGHEHVDRARGHREVARGRLRDLRAQRRA